MDSAKYRIAIIEDDAAVRAALTVLLGAPGFDTMSYESAEAFIERLSSHVVDCILSDQNLPGMSGIALSEFLRARNVNTPQVLITGHDEP